jgi:death-on-curing protein
VKAPRWLDRAECSAIHDLMLAQYGGLGGVRDESLLESALAKPQNRFAYENAAITDLAASYAAGIVHNHPFFDGNKRTGFMLGATLLELNGWQFTAPEIEVVEQTLGLAANAIDEKQYAIWLAANAKKA